MTTSAAQASFDRGPWRRGGFTLIEILLCIAIIVVLLTLGSVAISSLNAQRYMQDKLSAIENCALLAHNGVLRDQEPWVVVFEHGGCSVGPMSRGLTKVREEGAEAPPSVQHVDFKGDEVLLMKRTAWKEWLRVDVPEFWRFEPRAIIEPIEIRLESAKRGNIQGRFDRLTARLNDVVYTSPP